MIHGIAEGRQLAVVANGLNIVAREDDRLAIGDVDALHATQNAADMHPETVAELQVTELLSCPDRVFRNDEVGNVDVPVKQLALIERTLVPLDLRLDFSRPQVLDKHALNLDAMLLDRPRHNHQRHSHQCHADHQCIGETGEVVADVEHE